MVDWTDGEEVDKHALNHGGWMREQLDRIFELLSQNPGFTDEMAALKLAQDGGHPENSWDPSEDLNEDPDHPSEQALGLARDRAADGRFGRARSRFSRGLGRPIRLDAPLMAGPVCGDPEANPYVPRHFARASRRCVPRPPAC